MTIPAFAGSPNNKGDKTTTENLTPSPLPPPGYWQAHIYVIDPTDTCGSYVNCQLAFYI